jgi:2-haloalkanoic acid dehalogenase type II
MPLPADIRAVTFDCFGTLIDWNRGIGGALAAWASRNGLVEETDRLVRKLGEAQRRHQVIRPFKPYRTVLRDAFLDVARAHDIGRAEDDARRFAASVADWPAFADTLAGLRRLKKIVAVGVRSNVDDECFALVHADRLGGLLDDIVTADDVIAYKPDPAHFDAMRQRLVRRDIDESAWLHVAQSRFHDIAPCRDLGIACVWLDRVGSRPDRGMTVFGADAEPDLTVYGMAEVVAVVEGGPGR